MRVVGAQVRVDDATVRVVGAQVRVASKALIRARDSRQLMAWRMRANSSRVVIPAWSRTGLPYLSATANVMRVLSDCFASALSLASAQTCLTASILRSS